MAAARAAFLGADQRKIDRIGHEVGVEQETLLLALVAEIIRLAGEAALEVVLRVEDEFRLFIEVHHRRRVGHRDEARGLLARAVEMLVPAIERNGEQRARLPLEGDLLALVVPHAGGAAAGEDEDHFLEQLALRRELAARIDLADVAVVRGARGVVVHVHALAAAPRPGLQRDGVQAFHVNGRNDVEAFLGHPAGIGGLFLRGEFLRQLVRYNGVLCHTALLRFCSFDDGHRLTRSGAEFHSPITAPAGPAFRDNLTVAGPGFRDARHRLATATRHRPRLIVQPRKHSPLIGVITFLFDQIRGKRRVYLPFDGCPFIVSLVYRSRQAR